MANHMRVWPNTYKVILVLTVLLLAGAAAFHVFVITPLEEEYDVCWEDLDGEKSKVRSSEWDASESGLANATKLYALAIGTKKDPGARMLSEKLLTASTGRLQSMVDKVKQNSRNVYIGFDGKKTYSDRYDAVKKQFKEAGKIAPRFAVRLIPAVYGMGRASEGNYYNMTLKLLLTEDVVNLLRKHNLSVMMTEKRYLPETDQIFLDVRDRTALRKVPGSELTVLPVRSYAIKKGEAPFLLEVSLKARVVGSMKNFAAFAADLHEGGRGYAMTNLELRTVRPKMRNARLGQSQLIASQETAKEVRIEDIEASFICSGFAYPETDLSKSKATGKSGVRRTRKRTSSKVTEKPLGI